MIFYNRAVPRFSEAEKDSFVAADVMEPRHYHMNNESFFVQPFVFGKPIPWKQLCEGAYTRQPEVKIKKIGSFKLSTVYLKVDGKLMALELHSIQPVTKPSSQSSDFGAVWNTKFYLNRHNKQVGLETQHVFTVEIEVRFYPEMLVCDVTIGGDGDMSDIIPIGYDIESYYGEPANNGLFDFMFGANRLRRGIYMVANPFNGPADYGHFREMVVSAPSKEEAQRMFPFDKENEVAADVDTWPGRPDQMLALCLGDSEVPVGVYLSDNVGS